MKNVALVQVGYGTVGGAVIAQVLEHRDAWREQLGLNVRLGAIAGRQGAVAIEDAGRGVPDDVARAASGGRGAGGPEPCGVDLGDIVGNIQAADAVRDAREKGYTEPDPRDDLSGLDVARKALILARTLGREIDLDAIAVESLVPDELAGVDVAQFLDRLTMSDAAIAGMASEANAADAALKYVATLDESGEVAVGLRQIPRTTVLGALQGPENVVSFRTKRYDDYPTVVSGPGAGAAVTAAGMLGDALALARLM